MDLINLVNYAAVSFSQLVNFTEILKTAIDAEKDKSF